MRAVLGIAFVGFGLFMGYLVISGQFPSSTPVGTQFPMATVTPVDRPVVPETPVQRNSPLGLPTVKSLQDMTASAGGLR